MELAGVKRALLVKLPEPAAPNMKVTYSPPIGLWSIRANMWDHGYKEVNIADMHLGDVLPDREYDLVGLSCQFSIQDEVYRKTARLCRQKFPEALLVAGGFHAAAVPPPPEVDLVVRGSGEKLFAGPDSSKWELPGVSIWELRRYWERGAPHDLKSRTGKWLPIETSRGCWAGCKFCGVRDFWGYWHSFYGEKLLGYLKGLREEGVEELFIEDDNLGFSEEHLDGVTEFFRDLGLLWSTPNGVEVRTVQRNLPCFAPRGCWRVSLPFETGVEETARLMGIGRKYVPLAEAQWTVKMCKSEGLETCGFFIIGWPGESLDDMQRTLDYANDLPLDERHIYIATPYPGTRLYDLCREKGYLRYSPPELYSKLGYTQAVIDTEDWCGEEVLELREKDRAAALKRRAGG